MNVNNGAGFCETCEGGDKYVMALNEEEPEQGESGDGGPDLSNTQIKYLLRRPDRVTVKHVPTDMSGQQPPRPKRWLLAETVPKNLRKGVPYGLLIHQDAQYKSVHELLEDQLKIGLPGVRFMTVREAAKLQDCPSWYTFEGSWGQQRAQVGNAVPVNVARAVARQIMRAFGRRTPKLALVNRPDAGLWPVGGANVACQVAYGKLQAFLGTPFGQMELGVLRRERNPASPEAAVRASLTPDLLEPEYRRKVEAGAHPMTGHCYVASEALWHLKGGERSGLTPMQLTHEGASHWYLQGPRGGVVDLTAEQFRGAVPHERAQPRAFLGPTPSKRARTVIRRARKRMVNGPQG